MDNTAAPNVFLNSGEPNVRSGKLRFNPKWIFAILGAVVIIELIIGVRTLTGSNISTRQSVPSASVSSIGRISLKTVAQTIKAGDTVSVAIEVISPLPAVGVDIVAKFDPKILQASDSAILKGVTFSQFPVAKIDSEGMVRISAITTPGAKSFSGTGVLATINFKTLKKGTTKVALDFTKDSTTDSNIVSESSARDLLEEVQNLELTIR